MKDLTNDMENRRAWRILDFFCDLFLHHRKFTPFQKFLFVSCFMGVFLAIIRNRSCFFIFLNYCLSVYCTINLIKFLASRSVILPSDRILIWIENAEAVISNLVTPQGMIQSQQVKGGNSSGLNNENILKQRQQDIEEENSENRKSLPSFSRRNFVSGCDRPELEIHHIVKLIHKDFLLTWYDLFTKDELVCSEAEIILALIFDSLKKRLVKAKIPYLVHSIMLLYRTHVHNLKEAELMCKAQSKRWKSSSRPKDTNVAFAKLEVQTRKTLEECFETKTEIHPALKSEEFERAYQKALVDCILLHLLPNELIEIKTLMTAIKEILSVNVLRNLVSAISEPIFLYEKVILITSDEDVLDCKENVSDISIIENETDQTARSVQSILVKKERRSRDKIKAKTKNIEIDSTDEHSDTVKWKNDTKTFPVSKVFCCECNRLCSRDRDKISPRPHTCSLGSEDEVKKYDRLAVKNSDQGSKLSDTESIGSRESPVFLLSVSDSDSEFHKDDQHMTTDIPCSFMPPEDRGSRKSSEDLILINSKQDKNLQTSELNSDELKGIRNFTLQNIPSLFPKFTLNLPKPLSSIQNPINLGPLKLSPSDLRDEQSLDSKQSHSAGSTLLRDKSRTPVSPSDLTDVNSIADSQPPSLFQDIRITSTESAKEPGSSSLYTLYEIKFEAMYQSENKSIIQKTGAVKRRFREFVNLQTRLEEVSEYKKCMRDIKGPKKLLPSLPFGNMGRDTLESRKTLLENFIQALVKKDQICSSEEMKQFLGYSGDGHIAFVRKASETSIPRIDQRLVKTMSGVFDKIVEGLPTLHQQIPKMIPSFESPDDKKDVEEQLEDRDNIDVEVIFDSDESLYEIVMDKFMYERLSHKLEDDTKLNTSENTSVDLGMSADSWQTDYLNYVNHSPPSSPKTSHFQWNILQQFKSSSGETSLPFSTESVLKEMHTEFKTSPTDSDGDATKEDACLLSDGILDILTELLKGQDSWMCRDTVMASTRQVFGKGLNRYLQTKIQHLTSEEMNMLYLKKFREAFWPGDIFSADSHAPYTDLQCEVIKKQSRRCLGDFLPGVLKILLGADDFEHILDEAINSVKYERLNRHFWYSFLDILIEEVFPEIKAPEFQRNMSTMEKP